MNNIPRGNVGKGKGSEKETVFSTDIESNSQDSVLLSASVEFWYPTGQGSETAVEFAIKPENLHDANDHT